MGKNHLKSQIINYLKMIKFSHTIFALPFALSAVVLSLRNSSVSFSDIFWVLIAMAGARSASMGFNRIADMKFDSKNQRTAMREIPSGKISLQAASFFIIISSLLFIFASAMLSNLCLYLSVPVLILLFFYSFTKRFTYLSHIYLGFVISLAPIGAWIAVTGSFSWTVLLLSMALLTYIAGFDILYACQDIDFDIQEKLFSIPSGFGIKKAFFISKILHVCSFIFFFSIYIVFDMGGIYLCTVLIIGILLIYEHKLIKPDDLCNINIAFFNINSIISVVLFTGILSDELLRRF